MSVSDEYKRWPGTGAYLEMKAERDALQAEVERLRRNGLEMAGKRLAAETRVEELEQALRNFREMTDVPVDELADRVEDCVVLIDRTLPDQQGGDR